MLPLITFPICWSVKHSIILLNSNPLLLFIFNSVPSQLLIGLAALPSHEETHSIVFGFGISEALGLDGFFTAFFKSSWEPQAVTDFSCIGHILKQINCTTIYHITKVVALTIVTEFKLVAPWT
ncbi:hypothetical protein Nepgr_023494 [Nepenthes gracilis]|uniref:Uncharacterized protein n=1 Tax=Nepenthes gracilis TaxID=150966 RepID=A0AAD3T2M5_NEPGR|nr:hypothetical protein Nepgr_023494 [Nepenthes gracilis]